MVHLSFLLVLCLTCRLGHGVGLHGFHFHGLEEPRPLRKADRENITEAWIQQPVDHFNPRDNRTWSMVRRRPATGMSNLFFTTGQPQI